MNIYNLTIKNLLNERLNKLGTHFEADAVFFYGALSIHFLLSRFATSSRTSKKMKMTKGRDWFCC